MAVYLAQPAHVQAVVTMMSWNVQRPASPVLILETNSGLNSAIPPQHFKMLPNQLGLTVLLTACKAFSLHRSVSQSDLEWWLLARLEVCDSLIMLWCAVEACTVQYSQNQVHLSLVQNVVKWIRLFLISTACFYCYTTPCRCNVEHLALHERLSELQLIDLEGVWLA